MVNDDGVEPAWETYKLSENFVSPESWYALTEIKAKVLTRFCYPVKRFYGYRGEKHTKQRIVLTTFHLADHT